MAAANNPNQTTLSWTPSAEIGGTEIGGTISNYLVERCQGAGCTNFAQIATTPATTFNDTGLRPPPVTAIGYERGYRQPRSLLQCRNSSTPGSSPRRPATFGGGEPAGTDQFDVDRVDKQIGIADYIVQRCQGLDARTLRKSALPRAPATLIGRVAEHDL